MSYNTTCSGWQERQKKNKMEQVPAYCLKNLKGISEGNQTYYLAMDGIIAKKSDHPELFDKNDNRYYETITEGYYTDRRVLKDVFTYYNIEYVCLACAHNDDLTDDDQYLVISEYPGEEEWTERHIEVNLFGYQL